MGTIDQPKPSEPKSNQPEQRPLQPGQTSVGETRETTPWRKNRRHPILRLTS
jgi:hypothetical protein